MLASARIGAIHSVCYGGFSSKELSSRIVDCQPSLIITASCGIEPRKTIPYKDIVDEAMQIANYEHCKTLIIQREFKITDKIRIGKDFDYISCM